MGRKARNAAASSDSSVGGAAPEPPWGIASRTALDASAGEKPA